MHPMIPSTPTMPSSRTIRRLPQSCGLRCEAPAGEANCQKTVFLVILYVLALRELMADQGVFVPPDASARD
jgi:hypothetical protein